MKECLFENQIDSLLADRLSDAEEEQVDVHLSTCASCRELLKAKTTVPESIGRALAAESSDSIGDEFLDRIMKDNSDNDYATDGEETSPMGDEHTLPPGKNIAHSAKSLTVSNTRLIDLPGYEILAEIGRGGLGVVFKAWQHALDRIVAIKMMKSQLFAGATELSRFQIEAKAVAQLQHPNIVQVFDVIDHDDNPCLCMEYVEGIDLSKRLAGNPQPPNDAAGLVEILANAMHSVHRTGILHRDLKPANVLLGHANDPSTGIRLTGAGSDELFQPKITDFGLSKQVDQDNGLTETQSAIGTPSYMSPEQALEGKNVTAAADVYSLGAILYEMLTGRPPFRGTTPINTLAHVIHEPPVAPRKLVSSIPVDLEAVCLKSLEKEPGYRYSTAEALADDLRRFQDGVPTIARPTTFVERSWRWSKRHPVAVGLIVIALLAAIGVRYAFVMQQQTLAARSLKVRARTAVESVRNSRSTGVPGAIQDLAEYPREYVIAQLDEQFATSTLDQQRSITYARARLGIVDVDLLVKRTTNSPASEADNLITALSYSNQAATAKLRERAKQHEANKDWRRMARSATVLLFLGDTSIAKEMCRLRANAIRRTMFIDEFSRWRADLVLLKKHVSKIIHHDFRSGFCLAMGSIPGDWVTLDAKKAWQPVLADWYINSPDSGTHSAAGWALRKWELEIPKIASSTEIADKNWYVNDLGMTMIKIPAGSFVRSINDNSNDGASQTAPDEQTQEVNLSRPYLLSDREVTVGMFREFMTDSKLADDQKPRDWKAPDQAHNQSDFPAQNISWYDAVLFCNWLSRREGYEPSYVTTGDKETVVDGFGGEKREHRVWRLISNANGYRLPTEAEWEHACRAGTTTPYFFGDSDLALKNDQEILLKYVSLMTPLSDIKVTNVCSWPPNGWGFSEMHGNVGEWCHDRFSTYSRESQLDDPAGPAEYQTEVAERVCRGFGMNARLASASNRKFSRLSPTTRMQSNGFRLARTSREGHKNSLGMNMLTPIEISSKQVTFNGFTNDEQKVSLSRPYFLSDAEISVDEFRRFHDDADYRSEFSGESIGDWKGEDTVRSPTSEHPIQMIHWYDAVKFCNWLSRREGLNPAYELTDDIESIEVRGATGLSVHENEAWRLDPKANGYRLPTEAEWEHACRASSTTVVAMGEPNQLSNSVFKSYAVCMLTQNAPCKSKLPNGWGLFDMYGNVQELCHDWLADYDQIPEIVDSFGPVRAQSKDFRVMRGGYHETPPKYFGSGRTAGLNGIYPSMRNVFIGFRVARPCR